MLSGLPHKLDNVNVYSKDVNGAYLHINAAQAACFQVSAIDEVIGLSDEDLASQAGHAARVIENDRHIIKTACTQTFYESGPYNGRSNLYRSFKSPILGLNGKVIGVHGFSIPISESCLIPLSPQQNACLRLLAAGYSHKLIAKELGLSAKTVEHYLNMVKIKLNCESRADMVMQAIERGLVGI